MLKRSMMASSCALMFVAGCGDSSPESAGLVNDGAQSEATNESGSPDDALLDGVGDDAKTDPSDSLGDTPLSFDGSADADPKKDGPPAPVPILTGTGPCASKMAALVRGDAHCTIPTNGTTRGFQLHVPASYKPGNAIVLALSGSGSTGANFNARYTATSDAHGFALAGLDAALGKEKDSTSATGFKTVAMFKGYFTDERFPPMIDDVVFARDTLSALTSVLGADPKRLYAFGFSSGAIMSVRLGVELADRLAAVAVLEGYLHTPELPTSTFKVPAGVAPVSMLFFHGDGDTNIPYCQNTRTDGRVDLPVDAEFDHFVMQNGCAGTTPSGSLCTPTTPTAVDYKVGTSCKGSTSLVFYRLLGGNHQPYTTAVPLNDPTKTGPAQPYNSHFNATTGITQPEIVWNFFANHPKP
ncbi:MAG: hypothetical protein NVS3B20_06080 [Polyangiales bacterium]